MRQGRAAQIRPGRGISGKIMAGRRRTRPCGGEAQLLTCMRVCRLRLTEGASCPGALQVGAVCGG